MNSQPGWIKLTTRDGKVIKRYLRDLSIPVPLTREERGIPPPPSRSDYAPLVGDSSSAIMQKNRYQLDCFAYEEQGATIYSDPACEMIYELRDPADLWEGRRIYAMGPMGETRCLTVQEGSSTWTANLKDAHGMIGFASFTTDRVYNKWVVLCYGDARRLALAEF